MATSSWLADYLATVEARDAVEQADNDIINTYTKLADAYAALHQQHTLAGSTAITATPAPSTPPASRVPASLLGSKSPRSSTPPSETSTATTTRLRTDLTVANSKTHALTTQLSALRTTYGSLQTSHNRSVAEITTLRKQLATLNAEKSGVERRLRDRESELREGRKLVESVQDEMVGLEMQLNVKEERVGALEKENGELVERWMKKVGEDAKRLNVGSGWE